MTHLLTTLFLLASFQITLGNHHLLEAIAVVESRGANAAVGDGGKARGRWQMWQCAWLDVSRVRRENGEPSWPYSFASNESVSRIYAAGYLEILRQRFERRRGRQPTPGEHYAMWNLGFDGFRNRGFRIDRCPPVTRRAIQRLYKALGV